MTAQLVEPLDVVCSDVTFRYGRTEVLRGVSFSAGPGVTALLGPNGAGKTTLLRVLAGAVRPASGWVRSAVGGTVRWSTADRRTRRVHLGAVGWLPQGFSPPATMRAIELVTYAGWLKGLPGGSARSNARRALEEVGLGARASARVGKLSGGMQQRLGIAAAVVARPELLLLDEPTVGLDPEQRASFREVIASLGREHVVVISTHLIEDVERSADAVVVLNQGRATFRGDVGDFEQLAGDGHGDRSRAELAYAAALAPSRTDR